MVPRTLFVMSRRMSFPVKSRVFIRVWVATLLLASLLACSAPKSGREYLLPDPAQLTQTEQARALELAAKARQEIEISTPPVAGAKVTREVVAAVARYPGTDETDTRRLAAVTAFNYRTGRASRAIVDLGADRVLETRVLPGSSAPAAPEEVARARELLAENSEAYRRLFQMPAESYDLATFVSTGREADDLAGHRILLVRAVLFRAGNDVPNAIVDLTMERIVRFED